MLSFGIWEIALVVTVALVFVGPERLPTMVRFLGRQYGKLMRASNELRRAFLLEADRIESDLRSDHLKKLREEALQKTNEMVKTPSDSPQTEMPKEAVSRGEGEYSPFDFEKYPPKSNEKES